MNKTTLSALRKKHRLSQKELAKKLDISPSTLCMYENGKRNPPLSKAIEISNFFGMPVEDISFHKTTD